jgi:hypothetical protein
MIDKEMLTGYYEQFMTSVFFTVLRGKYFFLNLYWCDSQRIAIIGTFLDN